MLVLAAMHKNRNSEIKVIAKKKKNPE
jgi:hypothetical protein